MKVIHLVDEGMAGHNHLEISEGFVSHLSWDWDRCALCWVKHS